MGVPDKPEDPIAEFVFWQERRYAWLARWGPPSFLRLRRTNSRLWPYFLLALGGLLLAGAAVVVWRLIVAGKAAAPIAGFCFLGLVGGVLLYGGISWLIVGRQRRSASRPARPARRAR